MADVQLEVRVKAKELVVNGRSVKLDDSFSGARSLPEEDYHALELVYGPRYKTGYIAEKEAERIYEHLDKLNLIKKISVSQSPKEEEMNFVFLFRDFDVANID